MLKLGKSAVVLQVESAAAFARLCVETSGVIFDILPTIKQPPSRGCVLKLCQQPTVNAKCGAAAFARLCVETAARLADLKPHFAAAFGRLCVETL